MRVNRLTGCALWVLAAATTYAGAANAESLSTNQDVAEVVVVAPGRLAEIAGAATILKEADYARSQPFTINDVLRRVPGLFPRSEEGLGMRPNIGFRGLNPTRSTEVLLLEDGVPLAYAPYGDNASYYHPPLERFAGVEVLKGASQIAFGPHTVGGVINYVTPRPPAEREGRIIAKIGEYDTRELVAQIGDTIGGTGIFAGFAGRDSAGSRENQDLSYRDLFLKVVRPLSETQELVFKTSAYTENNQLTYSGLTEAEFAANPRGNVFANDRFELERYAGSLAHGWRPNDSFKLTTVLYGSTFGRDWWRQSSNSGQRPNDASDPACGGMANLNTTCGNEGRLRQYYNFGLDGRAEWDWAAGDWSGRLSGGLRAHHENQERMQWNGDTPFARSPGTGVNGGWREHNVRRTDAYSGFVQSVLRRGDLTLTTGVRYEDIAYERSNKLAGQRGESSLRAWTPGAGLTWAPSETFTLFAGAHKGFSPPRVEDIITNAGGSVELAEEESVNLELGFRSRPLPGLSLDATAFRMDFDNQIVPSSVAGGVGTTLTSAGRTLHQGLEGAARFSSKAAYGTEIDWYADATVTWVSTAEYRGTRFSTISPTVNVSGNRLPYAPEWLARASVGFETPGGLQAELEAVHTGAMFADDLNTVAPTPNGQRGRIDEVTVFNLAASWRAPGTRVKLLLNVRNLADEVYIVDRSRGILPGDPRMAQIGLEWSF